MTISELGAIGEFVAAIAVLITLIYLVVQIKQTQTAIAANTNQALNDISVQLYMAASTSESLAEALALSLQDDAKLTNTQYQQCRGFWTAIIRNAENMHYQFGLGLLEEQQVLASTEVHRRLLRSNTHFQKLWKALETSLRPEFRDWMQSRFET